MALIVRFAIVFTLTVAASVLWALYFRLSHERRAAAAAWADVGIVGIGMLNVVGYTEDHRLALPIILATWLGTFFAIRLKKTE